MQEDRGNSSAVTAILFSASGMSLLTYIFVTDPGWVKLNSIHAAEFLFSWRIFFFCLIGFFLMRGRLAGLKYNILIIASAFAYLFFLFWSSLDLFHLFSDSLCQVAYWDIIFRPNLSGSIGFSFTKPGQVLILGGLHQLGLFFGENIFKAGLCLVGAICVWSLTRVAGEISGKSAAFPAFFTSLWAFQISFIISDSSIYAIASLFTGLWLYFHRPRLKGMGRLLLVASLQFRVEAVAVLGVIWLYLLIKRDWRELALFTLCGALSAAFFITMVLRIQGSFSRLDSGGAVGYVGPVLPNGLGEELPDGKLGYIVKVILEGFQSSHTIQFLLLLTLIGIASTVSPPGRGRIYLSIFATLGILVANVLLLGGTFNLERYFGIIYAFGCSIGIAALTRYSGQLLHRRTPFSLAAFLFGIFLPALILFNFGDLNAFKSLDFVPMDLFPYDSANLLKDANLPEGTRLMTEDNLLYNIVIMDPDHFSTLHALQHFNILSEEGRKEMLAKTDYIFIERNRYDYFYLTHLARQTWLSDSFRLMVLSIIERPTARTLYGYTFVPVAVDQYRLLLRVERSE